MLIDFLNLIGNHVEVEISGGHFHRGILIDSGLDIVVIYDGANNHFLYIPFAHVQRLKEITLQEEDATYDPPEKKPIDGEAISCRKIFTNAIGIFVQVYVTGNKSIHGYITSMINDYIIFHSPVYKTMFISMNHIKWMIPYPPNKSLYALDNQNLAVTPGTISAANSLVEQLKKFENQLVILDGGDNHEKVGLFQKVQNNKLMLITAEGDTVYWNLDHIKMIQLA
ncbi:DUF2642 domain-containing protein [Neobacillus sp. Marseille-QA0830]